MRALLVCTVAVVVAACKQDPRAPATAAPMRPPGATDKLELVDFWSIAGITPLDTPDTIERAWGKADERSHDGADVLVRYLRGPAITFRADHCVQLDAEIFGEPDLAFTHAHPDGKLALLGLPCAEAAKRLAFVAALAPSASTTCIHDDANGWNVQLVTSCANDRVNALAVVWCPRGDARRPVRADRCVTTP